MKNDQRSTHEVLAHKSSLSAARDIKLLTPQSPHSLRSSLAPLRLSLTARHKQDIRRLSHHALQLRITTIEHVLTLYTLMIRNRLPRYYTISSIMSTEQTTADVTAAGLSKTDQNINNTEEDRSHEARGHKANLSNPSMLLRGRFVQDLLLRGKTVQNKLTCSQIQVRLRKRSPHRY